jgi:hypothetical protein
VVEERLSMPANCFATPILRVSARPPVLNKAIEDVAEPPRGNVRYSGIDVKVSEGIGSIGETTLEIGAPAGDEGTLGGTTTV